MQIKEVIFYTKEIFFPRLCLGCAEKLYFTEKYLCLRCQEKLEFIGPLSCKICSLPLKESEGVCKDCKKNTPYFNKVFSIFIYNRVLKEIIHNFKYNHLTEIMDFFSEYLEKKSEELKRYPADEILFVPMHIKKLKDREYNPAKIVAEALSSMLKKPLRDIIQVRRYHPSQTSLDKIHRRKNVEDAFSLISKPSRNILLVDDILTTGSTCNEISKLLRNQGAERIFVFTLARARI